MPSNSAPTAALKRALEIAEQIEKLEVELAAALKAYGTGQAAPAALPEGTEVVAKKGRRKRKVSAEARARMAEAARVRWAKIKTS